MERLFKQTEYYSNNILEVEIAPVSQQASERGRRGKSRKTDEKGKKRNLRRSAVRLRRRANANFTESDDFVVLEYKKQPASVEEAQQDLRNFERRLKRLFANHKSVDVKYIAVMEKGEKKGGIHFHILVSEGLTKDDLDCLWGKKYGMTSIQKLELDDCGLAALAQYLSKAPIGKRRWNCSHNLKEPIVKQGKEFFTRKDVEKILRNPAYWEEQFPGYAFVEQDICQNDINHGLYALIKLYKKHTYNNK